MSGRTFQYEVLKARLKPEALRVTAELDSEGPVASKPRSDSRIDAIVRLDVERLRRRRAEGRFVWTGNRIVLR